MGKRWRSKSSAYLRSRNVDPEEERRRDERSRRNEAVRNLARYCAATQGGSPEDHLEDAARALREDTAPGAAPRVAEDGGGEYIDLRLDMLHELIGGEITASGSILAPGPGHSPDDRSMSVTPSSRNADGYVVHSFSERTSWQECKAYVNRLVEQWLLRELNEEDDERIERLSPLRSSVPAGRTPEEKIRSARQRWNRADTRLGKSAKGYLRSRCLELPPALIGRVVRFEPNGRWYHDEGDWTDQNGRRYSNSEVLLFAMRDVITNEGRAVQIVRMPHIGKRPQRKFWGCATDAAIKLTPHKEVVAAEELTIGEGFETCLAAMMMGRKNVWAVCGSIAGFPPIDGVRKLTILGEHCPANAKAREQCANRWFDAGRDVTIAMPDHGKDANDELIALMNSCEGSS